MGDYYWSGNRPRRLALGSKSEGIHNALAVYDRQSGFLQSGDPVRNVAVINVHRIYLAEVI